MDTASNNEVSQNYAGTQNGYQNGDQQGCCPNCGYCPHCGRGGYKFYPVYPYWPPYQPYFGDAPMWQQPTITFGITTSTMTVDPVSSLSNLR